MIFMEKLSFHEFHEFSPFSLKTALFAPKCTLGSQNHQYSLSYGRISAPGRKSALFCKKSHFLLIFSLFTKITHFHDFLGSLGFPWKTLIWRYTGGNFFRKSCVDTFRVVSFRPKVQNDGNEYFLAKS